MSTYNPPAYLPPPPPPTAPRTSSYSSSTGTSSSRNTYPPPPSCSRPPPSRDQSAFSPPSEPRRDSNRRDSGYSSISNSGGREKEVEKEDDGGWGAEPVESRKSESGVKPPSRDAWDDQSRGGSRGQRRISRSRSRSPRRRVSWDASFVVIFSYLGLKTRTDISSQSMCFQASMDPYRQPRDRSPHRNRHDDDHRFSNFPNSARRRSPLPSLANAPPSRAAGSSTSAPAAFVGRGMRSPWDDESTGFARGGSNETKERERDVRRSRSPSTRGRVSCFTLLRHSRRPFLFSLPLLKPSPSFYSSRNRRRASTTKTMEDGEEDRSSQRRSDQGWR